VSTHLSERQFEMLAEMGIAVVRPLPRPAATDPVHAPTPTVSRQAAQGGAAPRRPAAIAPTPNTSKAVGMVASHKNAMPAHWLALDWQGLQGRCTQCQDCKLGQTRQRTVWGGFVRGAEEPGTPLTVDLLIVTDPPDEAAETHGQALGASDSPASQLLNNMVAAMERALQPSPNPLQRVFVTSITKCKPPMGEVLSPESIEACRPYLDRTLELLRPRMVLALGRVAGQALLGSSGSSDQAPSGRLRGQVRSYQGVPWVASFPVQHLLRNPLEKAKAWQDLCLSIDYLFQSGMATAPVDLTPNPSPRP
jgi:uracil-DNA glycosylase family 4